MSKNAEKATLLGKKGTMGSILLDRITACSYPPGGYVGECLGSQGAGKTGAMIFLLMLCWIKKRDSYFIWREPANTIVQWLRFSCPSKKSMVSKWLPIPVRIYAQKGTNLSFKYKDSYEPYPIEITEFNGISDLIRMLKTKEVSVIYFKNVRSWIPFTEKLITHMKWHHLFFDEYSDIVPQWADGPWQREVQYFGTTILQNARKSEMNAWFNTQHPNKIHYLVRSNLMTNLLLRGATRPKDCPVYQNAINRQPKGVGWLVESNSEYGQISFPEVPERIPSVISIADIENPSDEIKNNGSGKSSDPVPPIHQ